MIVLTNSQKRYPIKERRLKRQARHILELLDCADAELSLLLVNNARMRELNREHRGIPKTTDVLSFPLFEGDEPLPSFPGQPRLLGDVVLCLERIDRQARERSWDFEDELIFCLVHGVLHLLGYDHETNDEDARKMYARQAELFATLRPDTPYENYIQL